MPQLAFVMSADQPYALGELARTLQYELELQAIPSTLHVGGFPEQRPDQVYALLDPRGYAELEGEQALPDDHVMARTIFICAEPPPSSTGAHFDLLQRAGAVFVLDPRARLAIERLEGRARLLRPGYSRSLDHFDPAAPRPLDVAFLGAHSLRRTRCLSRGARVLSRFECHLEISSDRATVGDGRPHPAQSRLPLLAQAKVVIDLHRDADSAFAWQHALDAIHAGAVVVSEHSSGMAPLVAGEHLLVASPESVPYAVEVLLRDPQRLAMLRLRAYERLTSWLPYALPVSVLRAAIVELVGEPVIRGASLGAPRTRADRQPDGGRDRPPQSGPARGSADGQTTDAAEDAPLVTVIVAVSGRDEPVVPTLESLTASRMRDFEVVVIADDPAAQVGEWIAEHPEVAARLVRTQGLPGSEAKATCGSARNVGLGLARGRFCLIVDPGQELYPRGLEVLVDTLRATPDAAFAYLISEVTGAPDEFVAAGGDYLLSFSAWDRRLLRGGSLVHVPALIRTDRLRELDGFATDGPLDGLEDYDLWCRMAERGWRGQLVPQPLGRRMESGASRSLVAIHPSPDTVAALAQRSPSVLSYGVAARGGISQSD